MCYSNSIPNPPGVNCVINQTITNGLVFVVVYTLNLRTRIKQKNAVYSSQLSQLQRTVISGTGIRRKAMKRFSS